MPYLHDKRAFDSFPDLDGRHFNGGPVTRSTKALLKRASVHLYIKADHCRGDARLAMQAVAKIFKDAAHEGRPGKQTWSNPKNKTDQPQLIADR
jgi:hypothetical protein